MSYRITFRKSIQIYQYILSEDSIIFGSESVTTAALNLWSVPPTKQTELIAHALQRIRHADITGTLFGP